MWCSTIKYYPYSSRLFHWHLGKHMIANASKAYLQNMVNKIIQIHWEHYINNLMQECGTSIANTLELLQSCTKPWYNHQEKCTTRCDVGHILSDIFYVCNISWLCGFGLMSWVTFPSNSHIRPRLPSHMPRFLWFLTLPLLQNFL